MNSIKIKSYAKVNLTLEITGVENGYHMLDSLVASVDLYDEIRLKKRKDGQNRIVMHGMGSENIPMESNHAKKAADAFVAAFQTTGVDITVYKNIPIGAGLGGSSADIVGVLNGMAALYNVEDKEALKMLADSLGSDTGYMLTGGFARMQGRGEQVTRIETDAKLHMLLICPKSSVLAGACYKKYDEFNAYLPPMKKSENTEKCIDALRKKDVKELGRYVTNDLYAPAKALNTDVEQAFLEGQAFSPLGTVMTGSGSAVLVLFENREFCAWAKSRYKGEFDVYETVTVKPDYTVKKKSLFWRNPFALSEEEILEASDDETVE